MDDTVKGLTIGLLSMLVLHGFLGGRARHAAERQMRETFSGSGTIRAEVREEAPFGLFANNIHALDIYGSGVSAERLSFIQVPRSGWKGRIQHLRLHLTDSVIAGMRVARLEADIPNVTYDLGHAFYKDRLFIRTAAPGTIEVWLDQSNLATFAVRKFGRTVNSIKATLAGDRLELVGNLKLLNSATPFSVSGLLSERDGQYVDLVDPIITLNGAPVDAARAHLLMSTINPVVDVEKDLHLGKLITVQRVTVSDHQLIIEGKLTIPTLVNSVGMVSKPQTRIDLRTDRELNIKKLKDDVHVESTQTDSSP